MKHNHTFHPLAVVLCLAALCGCSDLLDEAPDNRTEINSAQKVRQLLTSAYPSSCPAVICELSADTYEDNNVLLAATHNSAYSDWQDEAFSWSDIVTYSSGEDDTPYDTWDSYYQGIAVCNQALESITALEAKGATARNVINRLRGEALVLRAYLHFTLVNVFAQAYKDSLSSLQDLGIPYVTKPETVVHVDYDRPSVTENYASIERDLQEGLPLVDDAAYEVRAYHMNQNAANAFAARFYVYKRDWAKAERYATAALGTNPSSMLRKWSSMTGTSPTTKNNWYNDETASCNFLIQSTYSLQDRMLSACRYAINGTAQSVHTYGSGPCWSGTLPCYVGNIYIWGAGQEYGVWMFRVYEYFEYTDKIAGIGYVHMLYQPFTAEETLLCRAEARLYLGDKAGCIDDLNTWAASKLCTQQLTESRCRSFYTSGRSGYVCPVSVDRMGWSAADVATATGSKHLVDCILHFRRIETLYEGLRWFDVKRYGIPLVHTWQGPLDDNPTTDTLLWDDPRRALQIPNDVVQAGLVPNDRTTASGSNGTDQHGVLTVASAPAVLN